MTQFKQALLDELIARAERRPTRPAGIGGRPARLILATAAAALVALVVLLVNPFPFGGGAAYAIDRHPDGTVTITFREMADPASATRDLRAAGVPAQVVRLGLVGSCPDGAGVPWGHTAGFPAGATLVLVRPFSPEYPDVNDYATGATTNGVTLAPAAIPPGAEVFFVEHEADGRGVIAFGLVPAPAPACWAAG
jgi:hypothetical protein